MSAGTIPYHLRQNKAIERNLFIDLLSRVARYKNLSDYTYVGFGGPFLEDFKHLHSALRIKEMISVENNEQVFLRQTFNQPISCVTLYFNESKEFIEEYEFDGDMIVWLDYASPEIRMQLDETRLLVSKLGPGDVFKITVNANPGTLGGRPGAGLQAERRLTAIDRLGEYCPPVVEEHEVTQDHYPRLLLIALLEAARKGVQGTPRHMVQPLTSFFYNDGTQMLTMTAIVLDIDEQVEFLSTTRLAHWQFSDLECESPKSISVPSFSVKERLYVESLLPQKDAATIIKTMDYTIGDPKKAHELMQNFVEFYRLYPWYSRVIM